MAVAVASSVVSAPSPPAVPLAPRAVTVAGVAPSCHSRGGVARYPGRPAPGSAVLPRGPLRRTLLRLALGCTRTGTPAVRLRGSAASAAAAAAAAAAAPGRVRLEFHVAAAAAGPAAVADADGGAIVAVTPPADGVHDEWVDLTGDRLGDLDMAVTVIGPEGVRLGAAAVLGVELRDRKGVLQRPLMSPVSGRLVGTLTLDYLIVTPLAGGAATAAASAASIGGASAAIGNGGGSLPPCRPPTVPLPSNAAKVAATLPASIAATPPPRFAGHRGVGKRGTSRVQENTLLSFLSATRGPHVSAVELDVQLTQDGHPVIYHDFFVKRVGVDVDVPVYSLTLEQWRKLAPSLMESSGVTGCGRPMAGGGVGGGSGGGGGGGSGGDNWETLVGGAASSGSARPYSSDDVDAAERPRKGTTGSVGAYPPFRPDGVLHDELPTLKRICRKVPTDVGFLVELKVPPPELLAARSLPYPERNTLVDATLARVFREANNAGRCISFLSFDADVVLMLRLKQDRYPVYYLNSETREPLNDQTDPRTITFDGGLAWASACRLSGMVLSADMVLEEGGGDRVAAVKAAGLTLMTYGTANSKAEDALRQMNMGVDGVIADNVAVVAAEVVRQSVVGGPPPLMAEATEAPPSPGRRPAGSDGSNGGGGVSVEESAPPPVGRWAATPGDRIRSRTSSGGSSSLPPSGAGSTGGGGLWTGSSASSVGSVTESVASLVSSLDEDDDDEIHKEMDAVSDAPPLGLTRLY
ncbi:hypothetical protein I4F81_009133 [Pyropia yezoensis]|uniref:Uncharacterized protein n=1 Tax=Pyropia yezoensis TaxID=2788 RepID=A0ACC3C8V8_PYRYE|nr:hypothetical protein I4F81_009133 [Neopyropia yezoensis]